MPLYHQTTSITGSGDAFTLNSGDDLVVASGVLLGSENANGITGLGSSHDVQVYGIVSGAAVGITLGTDTVTDSSNTVRVMQGGSVYGDTGINVVGVVSLVINDGSIYGDGTGVVISSSPALLSSTVINRGLISGHFAGIAGVGGPTVVRNYGTIEIDGTNGIAAAQFLSETNDSVINRGLITGDVLLGFGNDLYDGRSGTIDGFIFGGDGNDKLYVGAGDNEINGDAGSDTLIGGAGRDVLNGGTGTDRVSYTSATAGVTVNLSKPGLNTGDAKGDTYTSIEDLAGSYFNDNLSGNSLNNRVLGSEGDDALNGGTGNDSLSGGDGNDAFVFNTALNASTNVDTITDFNVTDDVIRIDNAVFTGLSTGTLASAAFRASTTGNAADATDRIMYETDTGKLFFDADGNGAGAKIQFATLDAGLALTNSDFVVI